MTNILRYSDRKKRIGNRIKAERGKLEINQAELAAKVSTILNRGKVETEAVSQGTISNWEAGKIMPPIEKLVCLAEIFNCDISYLLCDYDDKKITNAWICEATGLSSNAVNILRRAKEDPILFDTAPSLNALFDHWSIFSSSLLYIFFANKSLSMVRKRIADTSEGLKQGKQHDEDWVIEMNTVLTDFQKGVRLHRLEYNELMLKAFDEITKYKEYDDCLSVCIEALEKALTRLPTDEQNGQDNT